MEQPAEWMSLEGTSAQVNCTYSTSGFNGLSWYRQHEGQAPEFLSYDVLDGLKDSGRFSTFLSRSERYSYLLLTELQIKDSASYLCAVRDTVAVTPPQLHKNSERATAGAGLYSLSVCLV